MLKSMQRSLVLAAVMLVGTTVAAQQKVDVTGKWAFTVETGAGSGNPTVTLKQDGEKLTGHYSSTALGEAEVKGTVIGQKITLLVNVEVQGTALAVTYSGTVEGPTSMKGTVDLGGQANGTFTGKRQ